MLTLYLLRHAKSSWDDPTLSDFDRPLNPRGRRAAPLMARYMADNDMLPELILCSAAQRTRETLSFLVPAFARDCAIRIERRLYEIGGAGGLMARLAALRGPERRVLVIGHNPATEEFAHALAGPGGEAEARRDMARKFPTAALAHFRIDRADWSDIEPGCGMLQDFMVPRRLMD